MITIKSDEEIVLMRKANQIVRDTLNLCEEKIKIGMTTNELNRIAEEFIRSQNAIPSFLGYGGFPASLCISINEQVVHGIPSDRVIEDGDIVSVDCGSIYKGYNGDAARTFCVGNVSAENRKLVEVTKQSFFEGVKCIEQGGGAGVRLGDIGHAIQSYAESFGYGVVRELVGHGIGRDMHEDPEVPNYGNPGRGLRLKANMTIAIEPMITLGSRQVEQLDDGWTIVTRDNKPAAHYENTMWIKDDGVEILSL